MTSKINFNFPITKNENWEENQKAMCYIVFTPDYKLNVFQDIKCLEWHFQTILPDLPEACQEHTWIDPDGINIPLQHKGYFIIGTGLMTDQSISESRPRINHWLE